METLQFLNNAQQETTQPEQHLDEKLPYKVRNSRVVYICNHWIKSCFFLIFLIVFLLREIFLSITEDNIKTLLGLLVYNNTKH